MGMGMGWGSVGAGNKRTRRHVNGDGLGWGTRYQTTEGEHNIRIKRIDNGGDGVGVGWGMCYQTRTTSKGKTLAAGFLKPAGFLSLGPICGRQNRCRKS